MKEIKEVYIVVRFSNTVFDRYTKRENYVAYTNKEYAYKTARRFNEIAQENDLDEFYFVDENALTVRID